MNDTDRRNGSSDESDNDWTNSTGSSKYSDSDSSAPEWDNQVTNNGELVFMKYKENDVQSKDRAQPSILEDNGLIIRNNFKRSSTRRTSKGKFFKVLRNRYKTPRQTEEFKDKLKRRNQEVSMATNLQTSRDTHSISRLKYNNPEVIVKIDLSNIYHSNKLCRLEQLFGISIKKCENGQRLIVEDFLRDARAIYEPRVQRGYWLKKVNHESVSTYNINIVLDRIWADRQSVILTFQSLSLEVYGFDINLINILQSQNEHEVVLGQVLKDSLVSVLYVSCDLLAESNPQDLGVLYCYPRPLDQNFLYNIRGAFITLNHLMPKTIADSYPFSSKILVEGKVVNVIYTQRDNDVMLFALPHSRCNLYVAKLLADDIVRLLEFTYGSLNKCFGNKEYVSVLDHMFSRYFSMAICSLNSRDQKQLVRIEELINKEDTNSEAVFEQLLPMVHAVLLPQEARLQVDDALTELEAADYREFTDDPLTYQRLYVVIGSCLYYSGHLLSSHLLDEDLIDIHSFLRTNGLLAASRMNNLEKLILWKEVYVSASREAAKNVRDEKSSTYKIPNGRWFLMIICKNNFLLAAIMETGGCTEEPLPHPSPSPFYVEECETCIDLLTDVELDKFLASWFAANSRPQVETHPENLSRYSKTLRDIFGMQRSEHIPKSNRNGHNKSPELQTILKRRHHSSDHLNAGRNSSTLERSPASSSSQHNLNQAGPWFNNPNHHSRGYLGGNSQDVSFSEDSNSQKSYSESNEERVTCRRELKKGRRGSSSGSDSEWEGQSGSRASGSVDMSDVRRSLLNQINDDNIHRITAGDDNVLFHFVQLESKKGILLAPVSTLQQKANNALYTYILNTFRLASQRIHELLQNTLRFKKILSPSSSISKSLVAIKEHGILLQVPQHILNQSSISKRNAESYNYWVVGRLYSEPEPKELYVCYHESVPQDITEIAYKLSFLE